jgi:hypothetical protein
MIARLREYLVDRDAMQPGPESAASFESCQAPPCTHERQLHTVFRNVFAASHPQAQPVDAAAMQAIELFERAHVTTPRRRHQLSIGERLAIGTRNRAIRINA